MLSGLSGGQYVNVSGGSVTSGPYITADTPVPAAARGALRFNNARFEVWDGRCWIQVYEEYGSVNLSPEAIEAVNWVREKIAVEKRLEQLAQESPAVADAVATAKASLDRLQVVVALANKETHD
jgi:hypothetical protein